MKLQSILYAGEHHPVKFKQTRKWSHSGMKKKGLVYHATTSNSYKGGLDWLVDGFDPTSGTYMNGGSALFIVGREVGQIAQLGLLGQKLWHAGRINNPTDRFLEIATRDANGRFDNPNLYLDGVEFVGGVDADKSGKVEKNEVNLTEWQYECGVQIARWHAIQNEYTLDKEYQLTHQDIASDKPDLDEIIAELFFRLFKKDEVDVVECRVLQETVIKQRGMIESLISMVKMLLRLRK